MIGCICCHGPTYDDGLCPRCDWREIEKKYKKAKGGDASCPGRPTPETLPQGRNAAPTFNPKERGTVGWLIEELQKWPVDTKVYVDWDYEGGNENEADTVLEFNAFMQRGIKIS